MSELLITPSALSLNVHGLGCFEFRSRVCRLITRLTARYARVHSGELERVLLLRCT